MTIHIRSALIGTAGLALGIAATLNIAAASLEVVTDDAPIESAQVIEATPEVTLEAAPLPIDAPILEVPAPEVAPEISQGLDTALVTCAEGYTLAEDGSCVAPGYYDDLGPVITLIPCIEEDSINCYWDASLRGNGQGTSFVNIDGTIYSARG